MDFANRSGQPAAPAAAPAPRQGKKARGRGFRALSMAFLLAIVVLVVLSIAYLAVGAQKAEKSFVNKDKFQAVFLNGGQVYFGKIKDLNNKYVTLDNIYYLRVNQQVQPDQQQDSSNQQQDVSLAKLGCELHGPEDKMVINRDQVSFWENLKDDGQVAKAIAQFVSQNPNGQKCAEPQAQQ